MYCFQGLLRSEISSNVLPQSLAQGIKYLNAATQFCELSLMFAGVSIDLHVAGANKPC